MKKFAVTTFAVLYGSLVLTASLERFNEWIAQEALGLGNFGSSSGQHFLCLTKAEKSETHLQYKKIVERHFVFEAPREAAGIPTDSTRHISLPYFQSHAAWDDPPVSPRAPPFQI
jgi:hypothetical protein